MKVSTQPVQHSSRVVVASNIRAEMARQRISQTVIADALGKTQQTVSQKLSGRGTVTVDELEAIARVLNVHPGSLLGWSRS